MRFLLLAVLSLGILAGAAFAAEYNSSLGAPLCSGFASPCAAGSSLLMCNSNQASPGPEPNPGSNTIDSCIDSTTSGTCHARESVENLTITDLNNSDFRPGDTVRVSAWFYCQSTSDRIALYYANSASPITWANKLSGTTRCSTSGYQKRDVTFALGNSGGTHAVRAIIKYNSNINTACPGGNYTDVDDLAFLVGTAQNSPTFNESQLLGESWNESFGKCMNITIINVSTETLYNFTIYVNVTKDSDMQPDYADLRFYNASCNDGGTLLNYEMENYTSSNAHVWVMVPKLGQGNTTISVYYKNATPVASVQDPPAAWDKSYVGVWHLTENSTAAGAVINSKWTKNGTAVATASSAGVVDGADHFAGTATASYINTSAQFIPTSGPFTISAWAKFDTLTAYHGIFQVHVSKTSSGRVFLGPASTGLLRFRIGGTALDATTDALSTGTWYLITATRNSSNNVAIYVNGKAVATGSNSVSTDASHTTLGGRTQDNTQNVNGALDEARISNVTRTAGWLNQSYQTESNNSRWVVFGAEQSQPAGGSSLDWNQSALGIGSVQQGASAAKNATVTATGNHTSVTVTPVSGNGTAFINATPTSLGNLSDAQTANVSFSCSPSGSQTAGYYAAVFSVNSSNYTTGSNITVGCSVTQPSLEWNQSTLGLGSVLQGASSALNATVTSTNGNANVIVTAVSGNGTAFINASPTSLGNLNNTNTSQVKFNCSPGGSQTAGYYVAVFKVNSSNFSVGANITVSCTVTAPDQLIVTLNSPANASTQIASPVVFNCSATDNENLSNLSLYFSSTAGGVSAITQVQNVTNFTSTSSNTVTCTLGSAATAGNLLVTVVGTDKTAGTYTVPSGFTMIQNTSATSVSGAMAYKVATGGETAIPWSQSTSTGSIACWVAEYSGTATSNVLDVSAENESSSSSDTSVQSLSTGTTATTSQANELAIAMMAPDTMSNVDGGRAWSNGFAETAFVNVGITGGTGLSVAIKNLSSVGGQSSVYSTTDTGDQMYAAIATFRAGGGTAWHRNQSADISGTSNGTTFQANLTDNATYVWNCYTCDVNSLCAWAQANYTFNVNESASQFTLQWNQSSLSLGTVYQQQSFALNATVTSTGNNTAVIVTSVSGNGTAFINATPTSLGNLNDTNTSQVKFNCSPGGSQTAGYYEAIFKVNSSNYTSGSNITVSCTVSTGAADPPEVSLVSPSNGSTGVSTSPVLNVTVTDANNDLMNVSFYGRSAGGGAANFTIIVLPDTQHYSATYPAVYDNQTLWIANHTVDLNIKMVLHEGDIINTESTTTEWDNANHSMTILDNANVPYSMVPGNHDHVGLTTTGATTRYDAYFPVSRFSGESWWGGNYSGPGPNDNNYQLMTIGGDDYIFLSLDWCPATDEVAWANTTLNTYSSRKAILTTHGYILEDGTRGVNSCASTQYIWDDLIKHHENLQLVLCGHAYAAGGQGNRTDNNLAGKPVYQMLADYQGRTNGGNGYLRILTFDPQADRVYVKTYSTYLNQYETDANSQFDFAYNLSGGGSNFENIGNATDVSNGSAATYTWTGRADNTTYEWYVNVTDATGTSTNSITWNFTTLTSAADSPPVVALSYPQDGYSNDTSQYVNLALNASATDDRNLANCSLWHNYSGTWQSNQTQAVTGTANTTSFSLSNLSNKTFIWNIRCTDNASQSAFASANRTVTLDWVPAESSILAWNQSTLGLGSVLQGASSATNATVTSTGSNANVLVTAVSGNGTAFINATPTSIGNMSDSQVQQVQFTCSPPGSQSAGYYAAIFKANSSNDASGSSITVSCTVTANGTSDNQPPTTPTSITCNGGSCNISVNESVLLNCLGSTDPENDTITYSVEANLENLSSPLQWTEVGTNEFVWNTTGLAEQTCVDLRCKAFDSQANATSQFKISINQSLVDDWQMRYPVTYVFNIPGGSENLDVYRRDNASAAWTQITEYASSDFFNGVEAVRFDYPNNKSYVSVGFNGSNNIYLKFSLAGASYDSKAEYYDNRVMAFSLSNDNWGQDGSAAAAGVDCNGDFDNASCDKYQAAVEVARYFNIPITLAVNTGTENVSHSQGQSGALMDQETWDLIQKEINLGGFEVASHTKTHPCSAAQYGEHGYDAEINGAKNDILGNLTNFSYTDTILTYIETCGYEDSSVFSASSDNFIFLRRWQNTNSYGDSWPVWRSEGHYWGGYAYSAWDDVYFQTTSPAGIYDAADFNTLKGYFDTVYDAHGVMFAMWHADRYSNNIINNLGNSSLVSILNYSANRKDVWYAANGWLMMYKIGYENSTVDAIGNNGSEYFTAGSCLNIDHGNAPVITNISNNSITSQSAIISWTTDEAANGTVNYGTTPELGAAVSNATLAFQRSMSLTGLSNSTAYYYNLTSCDASGNCAMTGTYNFTTLPASGSQWYNTSFTRCKNITIYNQGTTTLTDFPLYVNLSYDSDMQADYDDIRFVNNSCNNDATALAYELENYTTGKADVWVKLPSIPAGGANISVYYGNSTVTSGQNPAAVWDSNYSGVWHLKPTGSALSAVDSTSNGKNGTVVNAITGTGKIGVCGVFDGTGDYINMSSQVIPVSGPFTLEAWTKFDTLSAYHGVFQAYLSSASSGRTFFGPASTGLLRFRIGGTALDATTDALSTGTWYLITATRNSSNNVAIYVNGKAVATGSNSVSTDASSTLIGSRGLDTTQDVDGSIDEIRISNVARSANWINQTYRMVANQNTVVTFGSEESE